MPALRARSKSESAFVIGPIPRWRVYPASSFFSPELGSKSVLGFFSKCLLSGHERGIASRSRITKQRPTSRFGKEMQKKFDVGVISRTEIRPHNYHD